MYTKSLEEFLDKVNSTEVLGVNINHGVLSV